ncbi:MAG: Flp pilus assembly complex ATPase component TadA [Planctomycetes bacterium]|nr:Flp pilus assembly complex ATPase component TadA [Planctomycetota bacterium]
MNGHGTLELLAVAPPYGGYFALHKVVIVGIGFLLWCLVCQWVDRDTDVVKTKREQWNGIVLSGGITGLLVLLAGPWAGATFYLGLAFWLLLSSGTILAYVIHRNGRVTQSSRVLTVDYFRRLASGNKQKKKRTSDDDRVRIADADGAHIDPPEDPEEYQQYVATQDFLYEMLWRRASDTDMLVGKQRVRIMYRIDGVATEAGNGVGVEDADRVLSYLKVVSGQNPNERRRPQSGKLQVALLGEGKPLDDLEVHTSGSTEGERLRLRLREAAALKRIDQLGFAKPRLDKIKEMLGTTDGLILFSGGRQTGVTTTQYAVLKNHDAFMRNIYTLEARPLLEVENVTQNKHESRNTDVSYARQLQTVLRRAPDVVMIGECPDRETAEIAVRAAGNGKKIYLALQGKDCFDALERFRKLLNDSAALSRVLLGVTSQRLVRELCTACRQAYRPDPTILKKANLPVDKIEHFHRPPTEPILDKKGNEIICPKCQGTGYAGRSGVFELLAVDDEVAKLLAASAEMRQVKAQCRKNKMYYLQEEGLLKVIGGTTSMNEIIRALKN